MQATMQPTPNKASRNPDKPTNKCKTGLSLKNGALLPIGREIIQYFRRNKPKTKAKNPKAPSTSMLNPPFDSLSFQFNFFISIGFNIDAENALLRKR